MTEAHGAVSPVVLFAELTAHSGSSICHSASTVIKEYCKMEIMMNTVVVIARSYH